MYYSLLRLAIARKISRFIIQEQSNGACRHGVPCITHAGTRHSKGSLEGGWRAPGSTVNICGHKVASQQACTSIIEVRECLQKCSLDQDRAMERLRACEEIGRVLSVTSP